jgi:hypothetical protein
MIYSELRPSADLLNDLEKAKRVFLPAKDWMWIPGLACIRQLSYVS